MFTSLGRSTFEQDAWRIRPLLKIGGGGDVCVTFDCGSPGWRATGGSPARTLVHETAFQLDAGGNDRGSYSVDLQTSRVNDIEVAAGEWCFIYGNENTLDPDNTFCMILGDTNYIECDPYPDDTWAIYIMGSYSEYYGENYGINVQGENMYVESSTYCFLSGYGHNLNDATGGTGVITSGPFGVFSLIEDNDFSCIAGAVYVDSPTYSGMAGINGIMNGDVYLTFIFGEQCEAHSPTTGADNGVFWSSIFGFYNYLENAYCNFAFGQGCSSIDDANHFLNGRILLSGDYPNEFPASAGNVGSGFNQASWFSQNDLLTSWPDSWTTARFQFPIISDSIWMFEAWIVTIRQGAAESHAWKIEGVIENDGGTTTLLTSTVTNVYRDVATKEWQAAADNTNDRLIFQYRDTAGPDTNDVNVQFSMHTVEVGWD